MGVSYGEKGVSRFERDVLRFSELCGVILALGVNDVPTIPKRQGRSSRWNNMVLP